MAAPCYSVAYTNRSLFRSKLLGLVKTSPWSLVSHNTNIYVKAAGMLCFSDFMELLQYKRLKSSLVYYYREKTFVLQERINFEYLKKYNMSYL